MPFTLTGNQRIWKPHPIQEKFIQIPDDVFEAMYGGAAGGGKSEILMMLPIVREWYQNPRFHGIIFRRTFPQLEESLIPRSHEIYPHFGAKYNDTKHYWTFPSKAIIRFSYLLKKEDARDHDTAEYNYVGFDELTAFDEFQYLYMSSRVRSSDPSLPKIIRSATNPGNVGHLWVRKRFVEPFREGGRILLDKITRQKRTFIRAFLTDNPTLMENDPDYINRLQMLPEAERRAKLDGDWWIFAGQVFEEWRGYKILSEPENAIHVIKPFEIPEWWPRILTVDWGYRHMTWAGWLAVTPEQRAVLYREYTSKKKNISVWGADIARLSQGEDIDSIVLDPSAWAHRGDERTIAEQFEEATDFAPKQADNDRVGGKVLLHEFLRWNPKPPKQIPPEGFNKDLADHILRMGGEDSYHEYIDLFRPEKPETNLPRLLIFNTCKHVIDTIPLCIYDEVRTEDVAKFDGDDPYDGIRYGIKEVDYFIDGLGEEAERLKQLSAIMKVRDSGDMTSFYRRMEKFEADDEVFEGPIKAFRRRR